MAKKRASKASKLRDTSTTRLPDLPIEIILKIMAHRLDMDLDRTQLYPHPGGRPRCRCNKCKKWDSSPVALHTPQHYHGHILALALVSWSIFHHVLKQIKSHISILQLRLDILAATFKIRSFFFFQLSHRIVNKVDHTFNVEELPDDSLSGLEEWRNTDVLLTTVERLNVGMDGVRRR